MRIETSTIDGITFVTPMVDAIDASNVVMFKAVVRSRTATGNRVALDLQNVSFVDSAGIGAILSYLRFLGEAGGDLVLVGPQPQVETVCDLVRLRQILEIFRTRDEVFRYYSALNQLAAGF